MRQRNLSATLAAALVLTATPLTASAAPDDYVPVDPTFEALPGALAFSGIEAPADADDWGWRIEIPEGEAWNGILVLYAHGFVTPTQTELLVQDPPLRPGLAPQGFAWAASSYSANGYEIERGVEETHDLVEIFARETGRTPSAVVIHGASMGGHITGVYTERYAAEVNAALPICGAIGDTALYDYFNDAILGAHALSGVPAELPIPADFLPRIAPQLVGALGLGGEVTHAGRQWQALLEQRSGGERPGFAEAFDFWNGPATATGPYPFLLGLAGGALTGGVDNRPLEFYDNISTTYSFDGDASSSRLEEQLNAAYARQANDGTPFFPTVEGDITVPVLSLHTSGDLFVPLHNEIVYAQEVADAGKSDLLVTRVTRALGHCEFSAEEVGAAFADLIGWMLGGPTPAGDDVLDPAAVADPDFGCTFSAGTVATRALLPACDAPVTASRAAGSDRIETAIAVAGSFASSEVVLLARSDDPTDALAGAALAGALDAPILLTGSGALDQRVATAIEELGATEVVLLGGPAALSQVVAADAMAIEGVVDVRRVSGSDRWATAAAIAADAGGQHAFVVSGRSSADALSVAALAAFTESPILLTEAAGLPPATASALADLGITSATIVGGTAVVSADVAGEIAAIIGATPDRLSGPDRFATSAAVVAASVSAGMDVGRAHIASGFSDVDALGAGPAAAHVGQVLALVHGQDANAPGAAADALAATGRVLAPVIAGGTSAVSAAVESAIEVAFDNG